MKKINIIKYTKAYYGEHKASANALLSKYVGWSTSSDQPFKINEDTQIKRKLIKKYKQYDTPGQKAEYNNLMALFFQKLNFHNDSKVEAKNNMRVTRTKFVETEAPFSFDNGLLTDAELNKDMLVANFIKIQINIYKKALKIYIKETGDTSLHISENAYTKNGAILESYGSLRIDSYKSIKVFWRILDDLINNAII